MFDPEGTTCHYCKQPEYTDPSMSLVCSCCRGRKCGSTDCAVCGPALDQTESRVPDVDQRMSAPAPEPFHPAPWWYRLAVRWLPARTREIPEALRPVQVLLRQLAIIGRCVYLQGFASGEDFGHAHAHGRWMLVLGLWGSCAEWRPGQTVHRRRAPYLYVMAPSEIHQVRDPSRGHTSLVVFVSKGERWYVARSAIKGWREHVTREVKRV